MNKVILASFKENNETVTGTVLGQHPQLRGTNLLEVKVIHPKDRRGEIVLKRLGYVDLYT